MTCSYRRGDEVEPRYVSFGGLKYLGMMQAIPACLDNDGKVVP